MAQAQVWAAVCTRLGCAAADVLGSLFGPGSGGGEGGAKGGGEGEGSKWKRRYNAVLLLLLLLLLAVVNDNGTSRVQASSAAAARWCVIVFVVVRMGGWSRMTGPLGLSRPFLQQCGRVTDGGDCVCTNGCIDNAESATCARQQKCSTGGETACLRAAGFISGPSTRNLAWLQGQRATEARMLHETSLAKPPPTIHPQTAIPPSPGCPKAAIPPMAVDITDPQDIFAAASVAQIHAALSQLHDHEAAVTRQLNALIASQKDLSRELGRLDLLRAHLGTQTVNTRAISNGMLSDAASTATRISGAVKRLDQEQSNVKATLHVVEQVAELKACVLGVHGSMGAPQDWETAAGYLSRAAKIPDDVVNGSFAEEIVPTAEVPDPPRVTLDAAAESLCGLFLREFEKAAKDGDGSKVTRFFKLFPLIGRTDVGLDAYGRYVCQGVASRARVNFNSASPAQRNEGYFYGNTITKLFEHIAQIVDGHEPLVERHYGPGMMQKVIERLQIEADLQGGIVLDTWHEERHIDRKLTDIKSYAFSFLVQSFLPAQKPSSGTPRASSPANGVARTSEDEGVDMKEIDALLGEGALILGRYALYARFISDKCAVSTTCHRCNPLLMHTAR